MITLILVCTLTGGCAFNAPSTPEQTMVLEKEIYAISRSETIDAVMECEGNGLRAIPIWGQRKINGRPAPIIVEIACGPSYAWTRRK
jgi:hypothetical protein|tara:strand:- start:387 stop:647 length:261 start_codon:yes stop_codon:yes gene_type:complete